jgi:hypothetical protein
MRNKNEIGSFPSCGKEVNDAYALYASLYLDYVDDNLRHFHCRGIDIRPIINIDTDDEHVLAKVYMDEALNIARIALKGMSDKDREAFLALYPNLDFTICA